MTAGIQSVQASGGRIVVTWEDGASTHFRDAEEIRARLVRDSRRDRQFTENLLLHQVLDKLDAGEKTDAVAGMSATLDRSAAEPVKIEPTTREGTR